MIFPQNDPLTPGFAWICPLSIVFLRCEPSSGETDQDLGLWLEMVKKYQQTGYKTDHHGVLELYHVDTVVLSCFLFCFAILTLIG